MLSSEQKSRLTRAFAQQGHRVSAGSTPEAWAYAKALVADGMGYAAAAIDTAVQFGLPTHEQQVRAKEAKGGHVRELIRNYEPKAKTEVYVNAKGVARACTPEQKAAWEKGAKRLEAINAERAPVTQAPVDDRALAIAKALVERLGAERVEALLNA